MLNRMLIVPDTHIPYHDERAWNLMLKAGRAFKPHTIVDIGDLADCYKVSSFSKDPTREATFDQEVEAVKSGRQELDDLGAARKVFCEGNHEDRIRRYMQDRAPELVHLISTDNFYKLTENAWELVPYKESIKIGEVYFTHDTGNSGKYTVARALDTFQHSVVIGHHHVQDVRVEGDATGVYRIGAQFGWLGDVEQVDYMHKVKAKRNWSLGFGIGYHNLDNGLIYFVPIPIVNYTCAIEGKVYRG